MELPTPPLVVSPIRRMPWVMVSMPLRAGPSGPASNPNRTVISDSAPMVEGRPATGRNRPVPRPS